MVLEQKKYETLDTKLGETQADHKTAVASAQAPLSNSSVVHPTYFHLISQLHDKSRFEVGKSSAQSKPTDLPMNLRTR